MKGIAPNQLTASQARTLLAEDRLTARALVATYLSRIRERDPDIRAWLAINENALSEAERLDALPKDQRGRLHGLPIAVKDVFDTFDLPTTHNSPLYRGFQPASDAPAVELLRLEGAIILGKTDTTEFAACGNDAATANPHDVARTPGGSSAGSAAAVADFQAPLALATQTGGSTIRPASFCGIYGMKPSAGLVSREGVKLYSVSFDTVGWYGRSVEDLALVADVYGITERLEASRESTDSLKIGITFGPYRDRLEPESVVALETAATRLREGGHDVTLLDLPDEFEALDLYHRTILHREGAAAFRNLARRAGSDLHDEFHHRVENRDDRTLADWTAAQDGAARAQVAFDAIASGFDMIVAPSAPGIAPLGRKPGDPVFNAMWTLLRVPCINVPVPMAGVAMPIGVTLTSMRYNDVALLMAAAKVAPLLDPRMDNAWQIPL
ncbi:amidase [Pararhizobium arenae]|uniref:amidase n=1 Tax=Pararhizobium arenae TaxID=1856850 RepID=UPI0009FA5C04|nr:amidase [Pararhizobium arenae]